LEPLPSHWSKRDENKKRKKEKHAHTTQDFLFLPGAIKKILQPFSQFSWYVALPVTPFAKAVEVIVNFDLNTVYTLLKTVVPTVC
jgi:hypothetical protein